jgi:anaerobic magnesium-protoporphyrin IX monomethyl ester cyclase
MKKVILYNPQSSAGSKPVLPLALLAVGAVLEGRYEYCIVDGNIETDPIMRLGGLIENSGSDCILAMTVMPGPQLSQAVPLCRELRMRYPNLIIVWGGYFPTQHWDVCLRSAFVDYVVRGHGELVFLELLNYINGVSLLKLPDIQGVAYRDPSGGITTNSMAPIPSPKDLPVHNFAKVPVELYIRNTFLGTRTLGYHSSYGCPFFCNFCAVVNMVNGKWLAQTASQTADVVQLYVEQWGVNAVEFYDNNFFVHEARTAEFSERILPFNVHWWGEARIDTVLKYSSRTWDLMQKSGLRMMFMGAESGSAETLKRMDKGGSMSPEKTLEIARVMCEWDIIPEFSFVMGTPPNPEEDINSTIEFIRKVKKVNPQAEIIMYLYSPVPLSGDLYDEAQAEGFSFPKTLDEWIGFDWIEFSQRRSTAMPWIKRTLQQRLRDFERVLNAYYPTATDIRLNSFWRTGLRAASAWRYHLRFYDFPIELRIAQRALRYQRPETTGF